MIKGYFKDKLYNNEQKLIKELLLKHHNFCGIQLLYDLFLPFLEILALLFSILF